MVRVAVIGLGRFGMAIARNLGASSAQVMAIDNDMILVNEVKDQVDIAVQLDSTDEAALKAQDIDQVDYVVIAIGENFEAALLTTVICRKLGVPKVICRARTAFHAEIFQRIGAHEIIQPETQAGENLARRLAHPQLEDYIPVAKDVSIVDLVAPKAFWDRTLAELALRKEYRVNLLVIRRRPTQPDGSPCPVEQEQVIAVLDPNDVIRQHDVLVLIGQDRDLRRLPKE